MTQLLTSSSDHLLADLVEELSQKLAEGNSADVEAFLAHHSDHAEKLRPLIPTLQMLVEIGSSPVAAARSRANLSEGNGHETNGHPVLGDFRILREVGRGGMGVVYEAEQISLRRRVALKVLPSAAMLDPRALQRFRNEAQAAAALHHSQIVPIFGVGCERGVHYYAMQFIDGLTLAEVITALRESAGLGPLYQPDLHQPEAQAKDTVDQPRASAPTPAPNPQPPAPARSATETDVLAALSTEKSRTSPAWFRRIAEQFAQVADALHHAHELGVTHRDIKPANLMLDRLGHIWITDFGLARIEGEGNLTMTGDLVGTLRYMSPEQALAKRIGIDHRTDIYSLGITLYELLTLHPALPGHGRQEILRQIAFEEPKPPRKHNAGIPHDLETIVLKMIEKNPAERYQTAAELAADLKRFVDDRHIEARRPSLYVRASRWTKKRQGFVGATAIILLLAAAGGLGWMFDRSQRVSRATALVNEAIQETALRRVEAQTKRDDLIAWEQASSSAKRANALAESVPVSKVLVVQARDLAAQLDTEHEQARIHVLTAGRDAKMLRDLTNARLVSSKRMVEGAFDSARAHTAYRLAFFEYGIDLVNLGPEESALRIRASSIRESLISGLLVWASHRKKASQDIPAPPFLLAVAAGAATESPAWHKPLIQALRDDDLEALQELANSASASELPPEGTMCLESALRKRNDTKTALALLRAAIKRSPGDFWLNEQLGNLLERANPSQSTEAIRFLTAAVALHPDSPGARLNLGGALDSVGHYDEAAEAYREAIGLLPDYAEAYSNLAVALVKQGKHDEGVAACLQAIRLQPKDAELHRNLGNILSEQRKLDKAVLAYRAAIDLRPTFAEAHSYLGATLQAQGKFDEAAAEFREVTLLKPDNVESRMNLGTALKNQGKLDAAAAAYREAIRLNRNYAKAYSMLGSVLMAQENFSEAIETLGDATRLSPDSAIAHCNLGISLSRTGDFKSALEAVRKGHELGMRDRGWRYPSAAWVAEAERLLKLDAEFTEAVQGDKTSLSPASRVELARFALSRKQLPTTAVKWYQQAFAEDASLAEDRHTGHRYNAACAALLTAAGKATEVDKVEDAERTRLKHQALAWLRDELAAWGKLSESKPEQSPQVVQALAHWQQDSDLASLRDEQQVQQLPVEDQELCRRLWADHAELVKRLREKKSSAK